MKSATFSLFNIVITEVGDGKSMKFVKVAVDFCPVVVVTESDRQPMKFLAVAVDSFLVVTVRMGD